MTTLRRFTYVPRPAGLELRHVRTDGDVAMRVADLGALADVADPRTTCRTVIHGAQTRWCTCRRILLEPVASVREPAMTAAAWVIIAGLVGWVALIGGLVVVILRLGGF